MKPILTLAAVAVTVAMMSGFSEADDKRETKKRGKGVEMYSWKDNDGKWVFALLYGTNRQKTMEEVMNANNQIQGVENLKKALALLAEGEEVLWSDHRIQGIEYPTEEVQKEIEKYAKEVKISLTIFIR